MLLGQGGRREKVRARARGEQEGERERGREGKRRRRERGRKRGKEGRGSALGSISLLIRDANNIPPASTSRRWVCFI